jgi:hypothetical protein
MSPARKHFEIAVLDDYQNAALSMADWSVMNGQATVTPLGGSVLASVNMICTWVSQHLSDIENARHTFDERVDDLGLQPRCHPASR